MISIIVTAYNQQQSIETCLLSILNQTYSDLEVILVDDGSTDQTPLVCQNYAQKDSRVHYYRKDNQGVSMARNYGLTKARGDWIGFIDGDDILSETFIECLMDSVLPDTRIVCGDIAKLKSQDVLDLYPNQRRPTPFLEKPTQLQGQSMWQWFFDRWHNFVFWSVCNKLFHVSLMQDKTFDSSYYMGEDFLMMYSLLKEERKILIVPEAKYGYVLQEKSGSHSPRFLSQRFQSIEIAQAIEADMKSCDLNEYVSYATQNVTRQMTTYLFDYGRHKKMVNQEDTKRVRQVQHLLQRQYRKGIPFLKWLLAAYYPQGIKIKDYLRR